MAQEDVELKRNHGSDSLCGGGQGRDFLVANSDGGRFLVDVPDSRIWLGSIYFRSGASPKRGPSKVRPFCGGDRRVVSGVTPVTC